MSLDVLTTPQYINLIKKSLRNTDTNHIGGNRNPLVIKAVLESYDLDTFVSTYTGSYSELIAHFQGHVDQVQSALENF